MYLTREEERIYAGEEGWTKKKALEILVAIGEIHNAPRLVPITSAHISGASYKTIGDAFEFITRLRGRVQVRSTLNPIGMDRERWHVQAIPEEFVRKQQEILAAYERLGISTACSCVPYLIGNRPLPGEHLAWAESSAVLYANAILGARTNMEGAPSALAAALLGRTPLYGLHHSEARRPEIRVRVTCNLSDAEYSALGFMIGDLVGGTIPLIELPPACSPSGDELKYLSAALGATGSIGMYHIKGITPEAAAFDSPSERIELEARDIQRFFEEEGEADVIAIGCPHCSAVELHRLYELLRAVGKGRRVRRDFFLFTAKAIRDRSPELVEKIEAYGVTVICDTCFVVSPTFERYHAVLTNSGKMLRYVPLMCRTTSVRLCTTEECVKQAF